MLNTEQIANFSRQGYVVVPDVIPKDTLENVRAEYAVLLDALYDDWFGRGLVDVPPEGKSFWEKLSISYAAGCGWFQPMDISLPGDRVHADTPMHFGPAIFAMITHKRLLDVVESLIGPEITSNPIQHVRIKPPAPQLAANEARAHVTATDWHQDRAVGLEEADQTEMITCWVAVTDATVANGCLQVANARADTILPHCPKTQTAIADGFVEEDQAVPLPVKAGGMVIFHPLTPHASLPNRSDEFRWSFDLRFNVTGQPTGRSHFPSFVARSAAEPDAELKDWRVWKSMWEEARARLADAPHIPIHRWTSDAPYCA